MIKKDFLTGKDKKLFELAEQYEKAQNDHLSFYLDGEDWADLINWYAYRKQTEQAMKAVQQGLQQHPDSVDILVEKAYLFLEDRQIDAVGDIIDCIKDHTQPQVIILKATFFLEKAELEKADDLLSLLENVDDLSNIVEIAYLFLEHQLYKKSWYWLEKGKKYKDKDVYLDALGSYYLAINEYEKAEKIFNELIDRKPYDSYYWLSLARTYMRMNKPEKVIEACDFALVSDQEHGEIYLLRALAYQALDNEAKAIENIELAYKYGAMDEDYHLMTQALHLIDEKEWEKAYEVLMQVLEIDPLTSVPLAQVLHQLAFCLNKMGRNEEALNYCVQAEELNPDDIENYFLEGNIHLTLNNIPFSTEAFAKAIDLDASADTWKRLADMYLEARRADLALTALTRLEKIDPSVPELFKLMATSYLALNKKELFLKYNALADDPFTIQQLEQIHDSMMQSGATEEAEDLEEIIKSMK